MAARVVTRAYDDALRPTGLRATQISVLAAVGARGALSIKSLADTLQMERSTLTRNLRPLEERGYVMLAPERRYRSRVLTLTPAGRATLGKALPMWEGAQRNLKKRIGQTRWPAVEDALAALIRVEQNPRADPAIQRFLRLPPMIKWPGYSSLPRRFATAAGISVALGS